MPSCEDCKHSVVEYGAEPYDHLFWWLCDKRPGMANLKSFPFKVAPKRCYEEVRDGKAGSTREVRDERGGEVNCKKCKQDEGVICSACWNKQVESSVASVRKGSGEKIISLRAERDALLAENKRLKADIEAAESKLERKLRLPRYYYRIVGVTNYFEAIAVSFFAENYLIGTQLVRLEMALEKLKAERSTIRVAAIDEMEKTISREMPYDHYRNNRIAEIAARLKEA